MAHALRILAVTAVDVTVAISLFVLACLGSGWCQNNLAPRVDLYPTWFTIWMVPFVLYGIWRGVFEKATPGILVGLGLYYCILQILTLCGAGRSIWATLCLFFVVMNVAALIDSRWSKRTVDDSG